MARVRSRTILTSGANVATEPSTNSDVISISSSIHDGSISQSRFTARKHVERTDSVQHDRSSFPRPFLDRAGPLPSESSNRLYERFTPQPQHLMQSLQGNALPLSPAPSRSQYSALSIIDISGNSNEDHGFSRTHNSQESTCVLRGADAAHYDQVIAMAARNLSIEKREELGTAHWTYQEKPTVLDTLRKLCEAFDDESSDDEESISNHEEADIVQARRDGVSEGIQQGLVIGQRERFDESNPELQNLIQQRIEQAKAHWIEENRDHWFQENASTLRQVRTERSAKGVTARRHIQQCIASRTFKTCKHPACVGRRKRDEAKRAWGGKEVQRLRANANAFKRW
jgi:hypothetical protein